MKDTMHYVVNVGMKLNILVTPGKEEFLIALTITATVDESPGSNLKLMKSMEKKKYR